jgi:hypothetical protein
MSVTYTATLSVRDGTVLYVAGLLHAERLRRGTSKSRRALGCFKQAVLAIRWFLDGTRNTQLTRDNGISKSTTYAYLHETIGVLAARAPKLESALLAAKMAGYSHGNIDGTIIEIDRCSTPGPTPGVDLWWSKNTTTTAATSRSSPLRTAGRCGPLHCAPAGNTTPPRCGPTPKSCPCSPRWQ